MNKGELVAAIAKETEVTKKDVEKVLKALTQTIHAELKEGGKVQIPELGSFKTAERQRVPTTPHGIRQYPISFVKVKRITRQ